MFRECLFDGAVSFAVNSSFLHGNYKMSFTVFSEQIRRLFHVDALQTRLGVNEDFHGSRRILGIGFSSLHYILNLIPFRGGCDSCLVGTKISWADRRDEIPDSPGGNRDANPETMSDVRERTPAETGTMDGLRRTRDDYRRRRDVRTAEVHAAVRGYIVPAEDQRLLRAATQCG